MQKITLLFAFLILSASGSNAIASDCKVNDGDIASEYTGACRDGLANGKGTAAGRDRYVGEFLNGNKHGKGTYKWSNGGRYEGEWVNDGRHGFGIHYTSGPDAFLPEGISEIGKQHGPIIVGLWRSDKIYKRFYYDCSSKVECEQKESKEIAEGNARKKAWVGELNNKNPQAMYLKAGTLMRNGDIGKAVELYEALITKHANSVWAVKASDQLDQNRRENSTRESIGRANSDAARRAYQQCKIEMDTCYSRGGSNCYRNCDSLN
ncbi:hypothetical protein [Undibacterium sp. Ji22W]|uniref:hypothetical protein n=1 Tax=Undibacterium sp. Ji22W TaxID=3413038 RepID=UPI003BF0E25E